MTGSEWEKVKAIFNSVLEKSESKRAEQLARLCEGDAELQRNVDDLLNAYETDFLESNIVGTTRETDATTGRLTPGQEMGHYEISRALGAGGMGEVYLARDLVLHRDVAIKVLTASRAGTDEARQRLLREARSAAGLDHPNICSIYEVGENDGVAFIAMQYMDGTTLAKRIKSGPVAVDEALRIGIEIADALAAAHKAGIIHRDIKPENIMLTTTGQVKVMDFGLAKLTEPATFDGEDETRKQFTQPGMILGTPAYMSPEQARGERLDARSDIFSLGAVLYEALTGRKPFAAGSTAEILVGILTREPEPLTNNLTTYIPTKLQQLISTMLAKNRNERFSSLSDVAIALKQCKERLNVIATDEKATKVYPRGDQNRSRTWMALAAGAIAIAIAVVAAYKYFYSGVKSEEISQVRSLAVLPLENLSGDPSQEYFADGMTEALISNLSQIEGLKVISRTSIMRYKGSREALPDIAKVLGVDAVIEGSVLKAGDRVRVTAQLIHAASDTHMWARNYERDLSDILRLQSDVAQAIAREIQVKLTPSEQNRLASSTRIDPRAHEAYLLGKFHLSKNSEEDISRSIGYFEKAVELEPNYADAYAGLAAAWLDRGIWGGAGLSDFESRVRDAATTAIRIDPVNANAHIAMCQLLNNYDYNWIGAEEEAKRALEIDPNSTAALEAYSWVLQSLGRHDEVRPLMERAELLDPVSSRIQSSFGRMLYRARRYDEAEMHLKRSIELDPTNYANYGRLGDVYIEMGRFDEAITQFEKSAGIQPQGAHALRRAIAYARMGDRKKAQDIMAGVSNRPAWELARLYTALGEPDKAFELLNGSAEKRDTLLVHVKEDPSFATLHDDSRWKTLLRRLHFPNI